MTDALETEWLAWHAVCARLKALGVDINAQDALARALKRWGEELAILRAAHPLIEEELARVRERSPLE
jgi:hypothetical protein